MSEGLCARIARCVQRITSSFEAVLTWEKTGNIRLVYLDREAIDKPSENMAAQQSVVVNSCV